MAAGWFDIIRRIWGGGGSAPSVDQTVVGVADTIRFIATYSANKVSMQPTYDADVVRAMPTYSGNQVAINVEGV